MDGAVIRQAKTGDIPRMTEIWRDCFKDGDEATRFIFDRLLKPGDMLVLTVGDNPAAMLSTRPFTLELGCARSAAMYIFGVATAPEHRGKGYSTELLKAADGFAADRGAVCSALVPASKSLFEFYGKRGFETAFFHNRAEALTDMLPKGEAPELRDITAAELFKARREFLGGKAFAEWGEEYLSFVIEDSRFWKGGTLGFERDGELCAAVCHKRGDELYVKELAAPESQIDAFLRALAQKFSPSRFVLHLREDVQTSYTNNLLPFGMIKWYDNKMKSAMTTGGAFGYIAHALD